MSSNENAIEYRKANQLRGEPVVNKIARYFKFDRYRTNFRTEILAGVTTLMTMAYILVINPLILSDAIFISEPKDLFTELVVATAVSAGIGTLTGVGMRAGYIDENGELPKANQALTADAIVTTTGAVLGASPLLKTFKGKARDVPIITWILAAIFIARFIFMTLRFG